MPEGHCLAGLEGAGQSIAKSASCRYVQLELSEALEIDPDAMARQQKEPAPLPEPFNGTTNEREPRRKAIVWQVWKGLAKALPNELAVGTYGGTAGALRRLELGPDAMARQQKEPATLPAPSTGTTKER